MRDVSWLKGSGSEVAGKLLDCVWGAADKKGLGNSLTGLASSLPLGILDMYFDLTDDDRKDLTEQVDFNQAGPKLFGSNALGDAPSRDNAGAVEIDMIAAKVNAVADFLFDRAPAGGVGVAIMNFQSELQENGTNAVRTITPFATQGIITLKPGRRPRLVQNLKPVSQVTEQDNYPSRRMDLARRALKETLQGFFATRTGSRNYGAGTAALRDAVALRKAIPPMMLN